MKQFDSNWTSNSKRHHLVPNTYLKGWQHNESSVYYIDKEENQIDFVNKNYSKNTKRINRINNFYSRRVGSLFQSKLDCDKYFEPLSSHCYTVKINEKEVTDSIVLNNNFYEYEKWEIYDVYNNLISRNDKEALKDEIKSIHIRDLEEAWNQIYENSWPSVRNDILAEVNKNNNSGKVQSIRREELISFMVSIEWRTSSVPQILEDSFNKIIQILELEEVLKEPIPEKDRMYPFITTYREEMLHNFLLSKFHELFNKKGVIYEEIQNIYNNMNIELLIPETGYEFITSDNPVCIFQNNKKEIEFIFPITPELACAVRRGGSLIDKEHYFLNILSRDEVFSYNKKIKKECSMGYILRQPSLNPYFK